MSAASRLVCQGCGFEVPADEPRPFRCPRAAAGDDIDHLLRRVLEPTILGDAETARQIFASPEENPFLRYRRLLHSYDTARRHGLDDPGFRALVEALDAAIAEVDGRGFRQTPLLATNRLAASLGLGAGRLWVKDETGNVSGSHKARHLMGLALWLEVTERLWPEQFRSVPRLAIASCGNAALGAAVVARAAGRPLDVFVPPWADPRVVARLTELEAHLVSCPRQGSTPGDPCFHRFREAIGGGALPFTCQGSENGLVIEGGKTLAWELVSQLPGPRRRLDHLFIQVGGGALATACIQGLREARDLGLIERLPRIHAVQTTGASPLYRAWDLLITRVLERYRHQSRGDIGGLGDDEDRARFVAEVVAPDIVRHELRQAVNHRSEFMWPWEEEPRSIATGILDDETYDWLSVVEGMLFTGGLPLVVSEDTLEEANRLARAHTPVPVDHTGTSGLAGLIELLRRRPFPKDETVAVLFSGVVR